jgi:hypothetical protein
MSPHQHWKSMAKGPRNSVSVSSTLYGFVSSRSTGVSPLLRTPKSRPNLYGRNIMKENQILFIYQESFIERSAVQS